MPKIIGLKELQKNTKRIREQVAKGDSFIVIYRSKPIFEIRPIVPNPDFSSDLELSGLYNSDFLASMVSAEEDIKKGRLKSYSPEEFLKSLT